MAITFTGTSLPQSQLDEIQKELYADWGTFRDMDVAIEENHKSGTEVYESKVTVNQAAYSSGAISAGSDVLGVQRTPVSLTRIQYADTVDYSTLLNTRFERSMKAGAFNLVSTEFDNKSIRFNELKYKNNNYTVRLLAGYRLDKKEKAKEKKEKKSKLF